MARDVISPYIKVEETDDGVIITCTDPDGTTAGEVYNGEDGFSPEVSVTAITGGHEVSITDADGTQTFDVMDGVDGKDGKNGKDGKDGQDGATGRTPEIFTTAVGLAAGATPYANTSGTIEQPLITFGIPAGQNGTNGTDGTDGVSPEVTIASITGGHSVTITDADHPGGQTFNVMDGAQGNPTEVNGKTGASITLTASDVGALPDTYTAPVSSVNSKTGAVTLAASDVGALPDDTTYAGSAAVGGAAYSTQGLFYGQVDATSTSTVFTATVPGITRLVNGTAVILRNGIVTSAAGCTLNVNGLGAKPIINNMTDTTAITTLYNSKYTMLFLYDETRVDGGCWVIYNGYYVSDTNSIGYQIRPYGTVLPTLDKFYRYRMLFTSPDGTAWIPSNTSSSTSATAAKTPNTRPFNPFGMIAVYSTTTAVNAGASPSASYVWTQYSGVAFGYAFNNTNAALNLEPMAPIYIIATPQADGSAVLYDYTQTLPTTNDGKIYIHIGYAIDATKFELIQDKPVYYHDGTGIRLWTGKPGLPPVSSPTDDGKVLRVVNGVWSAVSLPSASGVSF